MNKMDVVEAPRLKELFFWGVGESNCSADMDDPRRPSMSILLLLEAEYLPRLLLHVALGIGGGDDRMDEDGGSILGDGDALLVVPPDLENGAGDDDRNEPRRRVTPRNLRLVLSIVSWMLSHFLLRTDSSRFLRWRCMSNPQATTSAMV